MFDDLFNLSDDDYHDDPLRNSDAIDEQLDEDEFIGVALGAPKVVDTNVRAGLPVLAFQVSTFKDNVAMPFDDHAVLVGVELERNNVYAGPAVTPQEGAVIEDSGGGPVADGTFSVCHILEARGQLDLPWRVGKYLFTVILRDKPTNRVAVELSSGASGYQDKEVAKFLEAQKKQPSVQPVSPDPGDPYPSYDQQTASPQLPEEFGIALDIPRVNILREDLVLPVHGAFRLTALSHEIVVAEEVQDQNEASAEEDETDKGEDQVEVARERDESEESEDQSEATSEGDEPEEEAPPPPTAIIPITLLIIGSDEGFINSFTLRAPSYDPIDPEGDAPVVTGYFALDFLRIPGVSPQDQTYFIYAISGPVLEEAVLTALIPGELLDE